jgi:hypothetical protein
MEMPIDVNHLYGITNLNKLDPADREALVGALVECGVTPVDPETGKVLPKRYTFMDIEIFLLWEFLIGNVSRYRFYEGFTIRPEYNENEPKRFQKYRDNFAIRRDRFDEYNLIERIRKLLGDLEMQFVWRELAINFVRRDPVKRNEILRSFLLSARRRLKRADFDKLIKAKDDGHIYSFYENIGYDTSKSKIRGNALSVPAILPFLIDKTRYRLKYVCGFSNQTIEDIVHGDRERHDEMAEKLNNNSFVLPFFTGPYAEKLTKLVTT